MYKDFLLILHNQKHLFSGLVVRFWYTVNIAG